MHAINIIYVGKDEQLQVSGGEFGKNETLVLNPEQFEVLHLVLCGVLGWADLTDTKDAFIKVFDWMRDRTTLSIREGGGGKEAALIEVMKQFTECFWEATTDGDKKKFLMGIATELERDINDNMLEEWLSGVAEAKDRCQRSPEWSEDEKWLEFWEAIYAPAVVDSWFEFGSTD